MKIAIFGAGAIGGYLAVRLSKASADVSVITRGAHLAAMRSKGLTLRSGEQTTTIQPLCTDDPATVGKQDYVIVTLKAHSLAPAAPHIAMLLQPETTLVTASNGIPYWYFYGLDGPFKDRTIKSVDPQSTLWRVLPPERVVGCVAYPGAEIVEPGVIEHVYGNRFTIGEPDGSASARVNALSEVMIRAGLKVQVHSRIRDEIWLKLWGNLAFNPMSALTLSTLDRLAKRPDLRDVARSMMREAQEVAQALGVEFPLPLEKRIDGASELGAHKTSMLQDLERGRPMEIDALLGSVVELGDLVGKPVPFCRAILTLLRERARQSGWYPD
jgi:2-dehydropantoate 2-reductase